MGIHERKNRHKEMLRQDILDAAREMFVRDGYEGVSMRKIAEKIEYSPTTIYHYFEDKSQLLSQIVKETFERFNQRMEKLSCQPREDALHCLHAGMHAYIDFALEHASHYYVTFMMLSPEDCPEQLKPEVHEQGMKAFDHLRQAVRRAMEDGFVPQGDLELISQTAWGGIHGVASLLISMELHFPFVEKSKLIQNTVRTLLLGMGARQEEVNRVAPGETSSAKSVLAANQS